MLGRGCAAFSLTTSLDPTNGVVVVAVAVVGVAAVVSVAVGAVAVAGAGVVARAATPLPLEVLQPRGYDAFEFFGLLAERGREICVYTEAGGRGEGGVGDRGERPTAELRSTRCARLRPRACTLCLEEAKCESEHGAAPSALPRGAPRPENERSEGYRYLGLRVARASTH